MGEPFSSYLICPVLIGRSSYQTTLLQLMKQASRGIGQTVVIAGEAGIGKTRLTADLIASLRSVQDQSLQSPALILQGQCFEPDHILPYAPILDALRTFFATLNPDDLATFLGSMGVELVKLLPELSILLPGLLPTPMLDPEQEKRRLFQALILFLTRLARNQPLLFLIEDLHWCDETSLDFLLYLARSIRSHPILLVLTYRSDEIHSDLTRFLAHLDRQRLAYELVLTRLSENEVEIMIRTILALTRPVDADFLAAISPLVEGNPFFIEEILRSLLTDGEISSSSGAWKSKPTSELHIPRSVQVAVQQRLHHLSSQSREVLSIAAVAGRRFDFALLQQLTQLHESELMHLVKEFIAAQLVVEESAETFAFRHALTRQAVYTDMLERERKALHRLIAETMERLYKDALDAHVGDLAYHFYTAGEWEKTLEYAKGAGERAQYLYAPRTALEHFTHALEATSHLSLPISVELNQKRGQVYQTLGEFEHARLDYERALYAAQKAGDQRGACQSLLHLGTLWTERDYEQAGTYFHQAIELARTLDNPASLAQTLNQVGNWYANREQPHQGLGYHQEALKIFHTLNDQQGLAETLDFLGTICLVGSLLNDGITYYEQVIKLLRTLENRQLLISSLGMATMRGSNYLSNTLVWLPVRGDECIRDAEEALAMARQINWRSGEAFALIFLGLGQAAQGKYDQAQLCGQTALDIASEIEHSLWMIFAHFLLGSLALDILSFSIAQQHLERAFSLAKESGSLFWLSITTGALASTFIALNALPQAETILSPLSNPPPTKPTVAQRIFWKARVELELASHRPDQALHIIDHLIASAQVEPGGVIPHLWRLRGEILIASNRKTEAEDTLVAAHSIAQRQGVFPELWRICLALGKLLNAQGQKEQAEEMFAEAQTIIDTLAKMIQDTPVRVAYLRSAQSMFPHLPQPSTRQIIKQTYDGLTEREREIAQFIAQGKTSRALAEELFVSERTIEKHVERIMSKLGVNSRAQITLWAVKKGLFNEDNQDSF